MILPVHTTAIPGGRAYRPLLVPNIEGAAAPVFGGVGVAAAGAVQVSGAGAFTLGGASVAATAEARFSPTPTLLTAGNTTTGASSFNTASISPGANRLNVLFVVSADGGGADPGVPQVTGGGHTTTAWVQIATQQMGAARRISAFRNLSASPGSGAVTINFSGAGGSQNSACWSIIEVPDVNTGGTQGSGAVVQSTTVQATGTGSTLTLAAFEHVNNVHLLGAGLAGATTVTPDADFTELSDQSQTLDDVALETQWGRNQTACSPTHASVNHGYIGLEVKAA